MALNWFGQKGGASTGASTTVYPAWGNVTALPAAAETDHQITIRTAGIWSNLTYYMVSNDRGTSTARSRVNTANGNQVLSITSTGWYEDASNSDTLAAGDKTNTTYTTASGGTTFVMRVISSKFAATTNDMIRWGCVDSDSVTLNGVTRYYPIGGNLLGGDQGPNNTEVQVAYKARSAGTLTHSFTNIRENTRGGNSFVRSRVNSGNGNLMITVGAGVTGVLEDTSNSDTVVSGDLVNASVDYYADGNGLRFWSIAAEFVSTSVTVGMIAAAGTNNPFAATAGTAATYFCPGGTVGAAAETATRGRAIVAYTATYCAFYVISNGITATSTVRVRVNLANGNGLLSIGSGVTGYLEDASSSDTFTVGDSLTWELTPGGTGTTLTGNMLALLQNASSTTTAVKDLIQMGIVAFPR